MTGISPTEARFPAVAASAGHYESFYLKACHPSEAQAVWIRYTVHKRPGAAPKGSLWFTQFDRGGSGPWASKLTVDGPEMGEGDWIRIDAARLGEGRASGRAGGAAWELRFEGRDAPLAHLPRDWMYRSSLPRTKLVSPLPAARFDGQVTVGERELAIEGWRGMVGHNWGAEHAERWIWLHGMAEADDWIDLAIGRVRLGPLTLPWIANGAVCLEGERLRLGGLGRRVAVAEQAGRCEFRVAGAGATVTGVADAPLDHVVGWVYADPGGGEHHALNCSVADLRLSIERPGAAGSELVVHGGAAYELGLREQDHGVAIQPFTDG